MNIGIIGLGKMGEAIASYLMNSSGYEVYFSESDNIRAKEIASRYKELKNVELKELIELSSVIIIAVKPQNFKELLSAISSIQAEDKLFVSIAAGVSIDFIVSEGSLEKVARAMPNMGALIGKSFTAISCSDKVDDKEVELIEEIFSNIGSVKEVREELMDSITAISGSGPAYFAYFIKAIEDLAVEAGLEDASSEIVLETLRGTLSILKELDISTAELIDRVKSPGGTTEACLDYWQESNFSKIVKDGIRRAIAKSKELGE